MSRTRLHYSLLEEIQLNKNVFNDERNWIIFTNEGSIKVSSQILYKHLKEDLKLKISDKGNYFLFEKGIYRKISTREFKFIIKSHIPIELRKPKDWNSVWEEFNTDEPTVIESDFNSDENIIGFENGVLKLDTGKIVDYDETMLLTRRVACKYISNKTLDDAPIFKKYLENLCNNNNVQMDFLLEYIGAILSNVKGWRFKTLLILVGEGNTGKTQIREVTMNLLGREHCVSIDIKKLNERFGASQLYCKRLAGSGDMSTVEIEEMNIIKNLTGGDSLFAEFKGKDGFSFRYDGFLWFNTNSLPYFRGDRGEHVYERFAIIKCEKVVPKKERDPQLINKIMDEKNVIASVAVDKFKQALDRGYKFSEDDIMIETRRNYIIENNSLLSFIKECFDYYPDCHYIKRSDFNKYYKMWCAANRVYPERDREIGKQLKTHFGIEARKTRGYYCYPIEIKEEVLNEFEIDK